MSPSSKRWSDLFFSSLKITAILFLFAAVCLGSPSRDTGLTQVTKAMELTFSDTTQDKKPAFRRSVSSGESASGVRDSSHRAKTDARRGDSPAVKSAADLSSAARLLDSVSAIKSIRRADSTIAKASTVAKRDTVTAVSNAKNGGSVRTTKSEARFAQQSSGSFSNRPVGFSTAVLARILVLLMSVAIVVACATVGMGKVRKKIGAKRFLTTTRLSVMDKEVQRTCRFIEKNFMDPNLSPKSVCEALVTGEAFVEALMERDLGIGVNNFIAHVRINRARMILDKDPLASKESVSLQTGFADVESFCASFQKIAGASFDRYSQLAKSSS
jgi:AraC-like DNA-binding protein